MKFRSSVMGATALALLLGFGGLAARADDAIPTTPEPGTFKIAMEPWLGYGQWVIADSKGFFKEHGLQDVQLVNFTQDKDLNAALASGRHRRAVTLRERARHAWGTSRSRGTTRR